MKILMTAFDSFGGESVNPAQEGRQACRCNRPWGRSNQDRGSDCVRQGHRGGGGSDAPSMSMEDISRALRASLEAIIKYEEDIELAGGAEY